MPNTTRQWFQRRHYEFLVNWAATNVTPTAVASLADLLQVDNPSFDRKRFLKTYVELRRFARLHETLQPKTPTGEIIRWIGEQILDGGRETEDQRRRFNEAADAVINADLDSARSSGKPVEGRKDFLAPDDRPVDSRHPSGFQSAPVRDRECLSCHHKWTAPVKMSPLTRNLSGEASVFCPACQSRNVMSLPWKAATINMDAHIRAHADANRGRGMWEYTRCWKCANGTRPDQCPVACKGACEYPSAVND